MALKVAKYLFSLLLNWTFALYGVFKSLHYPSSKSYTQSVVKNGSSPDVKRRKGHIEGKIYEKISLILLAKNGYEHSKYSNSNFRNFALGREVGIGKDGKFDDIVFSYTDQDNTKNLIFVQIKHKQDYYLIDSKVLSTKASLAKDGRVNINDGKKGKIIMDYGHMARDFNLQKYFISFLSVRDELKITKSQELRHGKVKYVAIFTNAGLDTDELKTKGFKLKKAPDDIVKFFTLKNPSLKTEEFNNFYQVNSVNEDLYRLFKKSSDLNRLARELAEYVVWEKYRKMNILGIDESPMKYYHVALAREVIQVSDKIRTVTSKKQNSKNISYREAQFRTDFIDNKEAGSKQELRDALIEAIREIDAENKFLNYDISNTDLITTYIFKNLFYFLRNIVNYFLRRRSMTDDEIKQKMKQVKWNVVHNFGQSKQNKLSKLLGDWVVVTDEDVADFLKSLVFIVNQPRMEELEVFFNSSVRGTVVENTSFRQVLDKIENAGPELRKNVEKILGIYQTANNKETWISGENILNFVEEQKQLINVSFVASTTTQIYESEILQYGKFMKIGKEMEACLDSFLLNSAQILCINTSTTVLSSIKVLQHLNIRKRFTSEDYRISIKSEILKSKEIKESILEAFASESNDLLFIECRYPVYEQDIKEFYDILTVEVEGRRNKKIILVQNNEHRHVAPCKNLITDFKNPEEFLLEDDFIHIRDFQPIVDPFKKEIIIFQGQEKKISLSALIGIPSWDDYVEHLSKQNLQNEQCVIDIQAIVDIIIDDEIEIGSKPLGTSSLEGAYATLYEEIDKNTLINKLLSEEVDSNTNDIYVISGISGSNKEETLDNLIYYLGLVNNQERIKRKFGDSSSDCKIQIADVDFNDDDFKRICCYHPEKRIFWVRHVKKDVEKESNFFLQELYSPNFYIKRKFKNIVISNSIKKLLMNKDFSGIYIFYSVNNLQELIDSLQFEKKCEEEQFVNNCKNGKIKFFTSQTEAEASFQKKCEQNLFVHLFKLKNNQIIWCNSHDSVHNLESNVDREKSGMSLTEEENFVELIKDRKVVIIADDPGMGKSTTLTKLYELKYKSKSFSETHWVFRINLKDHLHAVRALDLENEDYDVLKLITFLSKVDLKLNHSLAKNLLLATLLNRMNQISRPALFVFDGFDEVLDEGDRKRFMSLFNFLKNRTAAKLWITTRRHYQANLELELSTFATQLHPLDDYTKMAYIKKYLYDRCYLILNEKKFAELFVHIDVDEHESIRKYTGTFIDKLKSVFKDNVPSFIGTPLQLYLMLEDSITHFRDWIENTEDQNPNFDYLGTDILEVYGNFIGRKYNVYFNKMGIKETIRKEQDKFIFNEYNIGFAKSLIFKTKPKSSLEIFKDVVLLAGIIKSHGSNTEFIHATFRDYFAAKTFSQWMWKIPNELTNLNKQEYLLKVILKKPDYEQIRTFINLELKKISETESFEKILEHYGAIFEKLFNEILNDAEYTMLHVAAAEGNKYIVYFIVNSFKGHKRVLKKLLFHDAGRKQTALIDAFFQNDVEIIRILLDTAEAISKGTLHEFLYFRDNHGDHVLYNATAISKNAEILKELLNRTEKKLNLIIDRKKRHSCLNLAVERRNDEFVKFIFEEQFKHDRNSVKRLLLFWDNRGCNALCSALFLNHDIVVYLLDTAKKVGDNNKTLKKMLFHGKKAASMKFAIRTTKINIVEMVLNFAKSINDDNRTLKHLFLNDETLKIYLYAVTDVRYIDLLKFLLETAVNLDVEIFKKLIFAVNESGKNAVVLMLEHGLEDTLTYIQKIHEEDIHNESKKIAAGIILQEWEIFRTKKRFISSIVRNKMDEVRNILSEAKNCSKNSNEKLRAILLTVDSLFVSSGPSALHIACYFGHSGIIKELLSHAISVDDGGATLKDLITNCTFMGKTPFEVLKYGYTTKIAEIVETLMLEARKNNDETIANILKEIDKNYTGVIYSMSFEEQCYIAYLSLCQLSD